MKWLRRLVLRALYPVTLSLGRLTRNKDSHLNSEHFYELLEFIEPGDILVMRSKRSMNNWFIPGFWSHVGMYVGGYHDGVVEAMFPKVERNALVDVVQRVHYMAVLRPRFTDEKGMLRAAGHMNSYVGVDYDLMFEPTLNALYCSEAVWHSYLSVEPDWSFEARERMGVETVTPQDIYDADKHFQKIWESA